MSNIKSPISFEILETGDGSPTLSLNGGEKMHSMEGALSESLYIYGDCLKDAMTMDAPIRLLSMGLGLGYNEWISLCLLSQAGRKDFEIHSYESQSFLIEGLRAWVINSPSDLSKCMDTLTQQIANHFRISRESLKSLAKETLEDGRWKTHDALSSTNSTRQNFNVILYDAFSSETDDYLWTEDHLQNFVDQYCNKNLCYFSTYAATGKLKRVLKTNGFLLQKKAGFGKKRESTYAIRLSDV